MDVDHKVKPECSFITIFLLGFGVCRSIRSNHQNTHVGHKVKPWMFEILPSRILSAERNVGFGVFVDFFGVVFFLSCLNSGSNGCLFVCLFV